MRVWVHERDRWPETRYPFGEDFEDPDKELGRLGFEVYPALELGSLAGLSSKVYEAARSLVVRTKEGSVQTTFLGLVNTPDALAPGLRHRPAEPGGAGSRSGGSCSHTRETL